MRKAIYQDIYEDIRKKIDKKFYTDGKMPPERLLAEEYGVNRITLRKALKQLYNEGLIIRLGAKGTFITESKLETSPLPARKIAYFQINKENSQLGPYHGTIMTAIQQELKKNHSTMFFYTIGSAAEVQQYLTAGSLYKGLDGIVIAGGVTPTILKQVKRFQLPIVMIGRLTHPDPVENTVDQVMDDPVSYTSKAVGVLLKQGCKRIAFVDSPAYQWSIMAQQTYMRLLEDREIEYQEELVIRCSHSDMREAYNLSDTILKLNVDGIFVRNDIVARGLYDGLAAKGIIGGRDIKWVSFGHKGDNVEHLNLIRLIVDPKAMGLAALEILSKRLQNPRLEVMKEIVPLRVQNQK